MEEVINELRQRSEIIPIPLDLPTEDDLIDAEEEIYLTLPAPYREFQLTVSDVVLGGVEPATTADRNSHTYLPDMAAEAWLAGLPRHLIPICRMSRGGYYCIHEDGVIQEWCKGKFGDQEWESIWQWAYDVWLESGA